MSNFEMMFKLQEKSLKDGSKAIMLIDNEGYICGVYANSEEANKAIPAVKRNILNGAVAKSCLQKNSAQNNRLRN